MSTVEPLGLDEGLTVSVHTEDGAVQLEGAPGPWLAQSAEVWEGVGRQIEVSGIRATPELAELRVADELHVSEATEIAEPMLSGSGMRLAVSSGLLQFGEGADGAAARDLLASLDDDTVARVQSSWAGEGVIHIRTGARDDLLPIARAVGELPEASVFDTIGLFSGSSAGAEEPLDGGVDWGGAAGARRSPCTRRRRSCSSAPRPAWPSPRPPRSSRCRWPATGSR
ncbi:hypothetical protein JD276_05385 [Leucobacter sp. CSA1]|uniref:Uncharacterized protein n=1 Tax=Leucobacter chromiisoli TaxID=2796471 RepID=A0A934Q6A9_9MICO|nr:hypothetical protein [Leucobacter chromiisoli]MBK0418466.1 hypothetical protein [Leucobacter chromiisoli]